jgi:NAD(P)H-dependent flavin oxidoreductase YrpB (nitropropane dioxygenase family)
MWSRNAFTERLNLKWPILQAPMGSLTTPALAAAVSNAGGLGGLGMWGFSAEDAERRIAGFRQQSSGSLNVNYPLWPEPKIAPQASEAMRKHLQLHYDAKGLGVVPQPKGAAGEVSREHKATAAVFQRIKLFTAPLAPSGRSDVRRKNTLPNPPKVSMGQLRPLFIAAVPPLPCSSIVAA